MRGDTIRGGFWYLYNFNTVRIPISLELQLFIRTVLSAVSSKFGNVVCDKALDMVCVCPVRLCRAHCLKPAKISTLQDGAPQPPPAPLPQGVSDPVTVRTYRVKYEPFLEQIPSSGLTAGTEKEEQFLLPCVFNDPSAPRQEFWRKKAFSSKGNENLASWPWEQRECCEKLGVTES